MATSKLTRSEIKEPDTILSTADHWIAYTRSNPRRVAVIAGGLLVLVFAVLIGIRWRGAVEVRDSEGLVTVLEIYRRPVGAAEKTAESFPDAAAHDNAVISSVDEFLTRNPSRATRGAALLLKAEALSRRGRHQDAAGLLAGIVNPAPNNALETSLVLALAGARANSGETEAAIAELRRLASSDRVQVPKSLLLHRAGNIAEAAGRTEEALSLYRMVADDTDETSLQAQAKGRIRELEKIQPPVPAVESGTGASSSSP